MGNIPLERLFEFNRGIDELVENSKFRDKMKALLSNPNFGEIRHTDVPFGDPTYDQASNCFGTLLWVLEGDINRFPHWISDRDFLRKYARAENLLNERKSVDSILVFPTVGAGIRHVGLYIGQSAGLDAMFHQADTGEEYCVAPVLYHMEWYKGLEPPLSYRIPN